MQRIRGFLLVILATQYPSSCQLSENSHASRQFIRDMADLVKTVVAQATENLTQNAGNTTGKGPSTPEGMAVAYGSLTIMALLPIFFGSYRSVSYHKENVSSTIIVFFHVDVH